MTEHQQNGFRSGFAAIIGRPNAGKSTLLNYLLGEKLAITSAKPQTTRNRIMGVLNEENAQIIFVDTPGVHTPRSKLGAYMENAVRDAMDGMDILLTVVDAVHCTAKDIELAETLGKRKEPKFLLLNKIDLTEPKNLLAAIDRFSGFGYDAILPISAVTGDGIPELRKELLKYLPFGPKYFPDDMITDQPERDICSEIIREKALRNLRDEVPHGIGVEILSYKVLREDMTEIHATIYCEKASHKGIIIGKQGIMLQKIGMQAREDIEALLGSRVNLQLWVKVRPDWRNNAEDLKTLGYYSEKNK